MCPTAKLARAWAAAVGSVHVERPVVGERSHGLSRLKAHRTGGVVFHDLKHEDGEGHAQRRTGGAVLGGE